MYKIYSIIILLVLSMPTMAQTDGISYQAVILDPNPQNLPGKDAENNILPNARVSLRFTVIDANNFEEYQEVQHTVTDPYGMVSLVIGQGDPTQLGSGDFTLIDWDGNEKSLRVDIDFSGQGNEFVDMDRQSLTFVPYAYHRNITATGTLIVDDITDLNSELRVGGPANLRSVLNVEGDTQLEQRLTVDKTTNLNDSLNVNNGSPAYMSGDLTVEGTTGFNGGLNVQGQLKLESDSIGDETVFENYPLQIQGSNLGMAIKVNGNRSIANNYISFYDSTTNDMWGRIEGITLDELKDDSEYKLELGVRIADVAINIADAGITTVEILQDIFDVAMAVSSVTACAGVGACVTAPIPSLILGANTELIMRIANGVVAASNVVLAVVEEETFRRISRNNIGVSYQSGAGDYAEWLPKLNNSEIFNAGDVVGVTNGKVSKDPWGAERVMIVSTNPIVLGNMPQPGEEASSVKIAFMGQVPTRIIGPVAPGDYVLPSELGSGFGKAVPPNEMITTDYKKVAGVVWNVISEVSGFSIVNVAVGINLNDLSDVVHDLEQTVAQLQSDYWSLQQQLLLTNTALAKLVPGFTAELNYPVDSAESTDPLRLRQSIVPPVNVLRPTSAKVNVNASKQPARNQFHNISNSNIYHPQPEDVIFFEIPRESIEASFKSAREQQAEIQNQFGAVNNILYGKKESNEFARVQKQNQAYSLENHPFWQRIDSDPAYKEEIVQFIQSNLQKAYHTHEKYAHNFTGLELKK